MKDILLQIFLAAGTSIIGYVLGYRKSSAETDNQVLKNLELSIGLYKNMIDDLRTEVQELNIKIQELEKMVEKLMSENRYLKNKI